MKPDRKLIAGQVQRFALLNYWPRETDLSESLALELATAFDSADSDAMVVAVTNDWIKANAERPTPADIYAAIARHRQETSRDEIQRDILPDPNCPTCKGDGWLYAERGGYTGAERCRCWSNRPVPELEREIPLSERRRAPQLDHRDDLESVAAVAARLKIQ